MAIDQDVFEQGKFEGTVLAKLENLEKGQVDQWEVIKDVRSKMNNIDNGLAKQKGFVAGIAALVSAAIAIVVTYVGSKL